MKQETKYGFNAGVVLQQLGGNKFIMMTGAKQFIKDDKNAQCSFKIGRNCKGVNGVRITLNSMDTYDMEFINIRAGVMKTKSEAKGVYNDQLQEIFTQHTGMYTYL